MRILLFLAMIGFSACVQKTPPEPIWLTGPTMGTTYSIIYYDSLNRNLQSEIDSLLLVFDHSLSTYNPNSTISKFNEKVDSILIEDALFNEHYELALVWNKISQKYYEPTVQPLVDFWGFGAKKKRIEQVDSLEIRQLRELVGMEKVNSSKTLNGTLYRKDNKAIQMDFSASAKGSGVDFIGDFLKRKGIASFFIEIGGEVLVSGAKPGGQQWRVAIEKPAQSKDASRSAQLNVPLQNEAIATSGNYRDYYNLGDRKIAHILNPKTGYPFDSQLLSVSIIAESCGKADAFATACMAMGFDACNEWIGELGDVWAVFITTDAEKKDELKVSYSKNWQIY